MHRLNADDDPFLHLFASRAHAHQDTWSNEDRIDYCRRLLPSTRRRGRPRNQDRLVLLAERLQREGLDDQQIAALLHDTTGLSPHTLRRNTLPLARDAARTTLGALPRVVTDDELVRTVGFYDPVLVDKLDAYRNTGPKTARNLEEVAFGMIATSIMRHLDEVNR